MRKGIGTTEIPSSLLSFCEIPEPESVETAILILTGLQTPAALLLGQASLPHIPCSETPHPFGSLFRAESSAVHRWIFHAAAGSDITLRQQGQDRSRISFPAASQGPSPEKRLYSPQSFQKKMPLPARFRAIFRVLGSGPASAPSILPVFFVLLAEL
ncbi:hypothetical protein HMPREF1986_01855 [Oribacterium sp. oral taxon 078 str. F0263]|nr:hypothetical protein HMPREF1986_01855 [Oribacterium sp. oral taxon 078 str. F0263]